MNIGLDRPNSLENIMTMLEDLNKVIDNKTNELSSMEEELKLILEKYLLKYGMVYYELSKLRDEYNNLLHKI